MGSRILKVKRVAYGKDTTSPNDREYKLLSGGPVGTSSDWVKYARQLGCDMLHLIDKTGTTIVEIKD